MKITAKFGGSAQVRNNVAAVIRAVSAALPDVAIAGATPILEEAQRLVPVVSGRLRDSIQIRPVETTALRGVVSVAPGETSGNRWGWDPPYAERIEKGFEGPDSLGRVYHQGPEPYMEPAFSTRKDEALTAMRDAVSEVIDLAMAQAR